MIASGSSLTRSARQMTTNRLLTVAAGASHPRARERAVEQAVLLNMPVARSLASRFRERGVPVEDLEQVAYIALLRAARAFDPTRAEDFLSYAVPTIRGELKKYFRDHAWTVRPPRRVQEIQAKVLSMQRRLQENGAHPTVEQIARELEETPNDVDEALTANGCFTPASLDAVFGDGSVTLLDLLASHDDDRDRHCVEARDILRPALERLSPRDQRIIMLRFFQSWTQQEIADDLGVTQMQVSRLLSRITRDLRRQLGPASEVLAAG
jgi:RNA polymerase sigma-B factor